jgi:hypothetical protein
MLTSYKSLLTGMICLLFAWTTRAQNLQGVWKGYTAIDYQGWAEMDGTYIMYIQQNVAGQYTGTAWFYETPTLYGELSVAGKRNDSENNWLFKETKFNDLTIPKSHSSRLADLSLKLFDIDGETVLQGSIMTYSKTTGKMRTKRFIRLSKQTDREIAQLKLPGSGQLISTLLNHKKQPAADTLPLISQVVPAHPDSSKTTPNLRIPQADSSAVSKRRNRLQGSYQISHPGIAISLYDYGTIDHDTVTVYFNGVKVADRQELTAKPLHIPLTADPTREVQELILHANNLGDIPPNTAKMVILTSDKRYELKVSSSETENAMIRFRYTPEMKGR